MECPRSTATSGSLIPCKFCHKKSFHSQSQLCEHEVEEHGYVRPCTVTTPKVTPRIKSSAKRNMDLHPLNLSDPKATAKLWAKWTQENEKLFRECVLNMKSSQSINLPTSLCNSSYYLDFVPDYSSSEFPSSLHFLTAGSSVALETDPVSGLTLVPASVEFQTVPVICASDSTTLEIVEENELESLEVNDVVYEPTLSVVDSAVVADEANASINMSPGNSDKEELILIPAAADPEIVEGAVIEAVDICTPSQGILDTTDIILGEDPCVATEIQSGQLLLDDCVLNEIKGQLILPNNAVLNPSSGLAASQDTQPFACIQTITDQPILDETTGEFILNCASAVQVLPTMVMNQDGNIIAVPAAAVPAGITVQPAGRYAVTQDITQTCTGDVANEDLLIENGDLFSSVGSGNQSLEAISEVQVVNPKGEVIGMRDPHIDVGSFKSKVGAVVEEDKIQIGPHAVIPASSKLQPQTSKTSSAEPSSVFLSYDINRTKSSSRNLCPKFLRPLKRVKSHMRKLEPSCGEKFKKDLPCETLSNPKSVMEEVKRKMARNSKNLSGKAIESVLKAISPRGMKLSVTDGNGNSSSHKSKHVVSRERAETRTLRSSRLAIATITTRSRSNKML